MTMLRAGGLLDVLTPLLSDCRQESVERWNGEFWGFRIFIGFVQWDFVLWVFVCSINFSLFSGYHAEGYHAPPIPYGYHAEGYHARTDTFKLKGYHVCRVTTPELPRSIQTSGYRRVITPAGSFSYFSFHRLIRQCFTTTTTTTTTTTFAPSLAHTARTHTTR